MAKLSARGRKELVRVERERDVQGDDSIDWKRTTIAFMSDGNALRKETVRFKPFDAMGGEKHDYGWKVFGKTKKSMTSQAIAEFYAGKGWNVKIRRGMSMGDF